MVSKLFERPGLLRCRQSEKSGCRNSTCKSKQSTKKNKEMGLTGNYDDKDVLTNQHGSISPAALTITYITMEHTTPNYVEGRYGAFIEHDKVASNSVKSSDECSQRRCGQPQMGFITFPNPFGTLGFKLEKVSRRCKSFFKSSHRHLFKRRSQPAKTISSVNGKDLFTPEFTSLFRKDCDTQGKCIILNKSKHMSHSLTAISADQPVHTFPQSHAGSLLVQRASLEGDSTNLAIAESPVDSSHNLSKIAIPGGISHLNNGNNSSEALQYDYVESIHSTSLHGNIPHCGNAHVIVADNYFMTDTCEKPLAIDCCDISTFAPTCSDHLTSPVDNKQDVSSLESVSSQLGIIRQRYQDNIRKLRRIKYYWGPLKKQEVFLLLKDQPDGTFLLRDSQHESYLLSLSFRSFSLVFHSRIEYFRGEFRIVHHDEAPRSGDIEDLIDKLVLASSQESVMFYRPTDGILANHNGYLPIRLLYPLSRFRTVPKLQHLARFEILMSVRLDHIKALPLPDILKDYLRARQIFTEDPLDDATASHASDEDS